MGAITIKLMSEEKKKISNKYEIEIEYIAKNELTPNQFILLNIIYNQSEIEYITYLSIDREDITKHDLYTLYKKDYIETTAETNYGIFKFSELKVTKKGLSILSFKELLKEVNQNKSAFDSFVKEYFDLFPEKIHSGNYLVKSNLELCKDKMFKFIRKYKHDRETILKATKTYIEHCRKQNYAYMKTAFYFILRENESILQGYCEQVQNNIDKEENAENFTRDLQ